MKFKKTKKNIYDFETIEVLQFNYDGQGTAIVLNDGELDMYAVKDIENIIFGDESRGRHYERVEE